MRGLSGRRFLSWFLTVPSPPPPFPVSHWGGGVITEIDLNSCVFDFCCGGEGRAESGDRSTRDFFLHTTSPSDLHYWCSGFLPRLSLMHFQTVGWARAGGRDGGGGRTGIFLSFFPLLFISAFVLNAGVLHPEGAGFLSKETPVLRAGLVVSSFPSLLSSFFFGVFFPCDLATHYYCHREILLSRRLLTQHLSGGDRVWIIGFFVQTHLLGRDLSNIIQISRNWGGYNNLLFMLA